MRYYVTVHLVVDTIKPVSPVSIRNVLNGVIEDVIPWVSFALDLDESEAQPIEIEEDNVDEQ